MTSLRTALETIGYEVMPFRGTREAVLDHVPRTIGLTVTASPQKGIQAGVDLAVRLAADGYRVAPHLSAKLVASRAHLDELLGRIAGAGIDRLFVIGGDGEPTGDYADALTLLHAIRDGGHTFTDIGIAGYPEGHATIPDESLLAALKAKAALADHVTTQVCFDPVAVSAWARSVAAHGVGIPVQVGVPGAVARQKLLRISASIGVGDSARFLRKQSALLRRFFTPGGFDPTRLVRGFRAGLAEPANPIAGFHVFTFNDVAGTERWRRRMLERS
ncbi:hypothetical protein GCM10009613_13430 [Pseudonocardia kongjuensis]|uniref:Methylenetetrahydrofolate reductase n=1 Tax=Pseudonocardia kongjuensis TaxID=102227 RepID=A0ABP4IC27_9PSEU